MASGGYKNSTVRIVAKLLIKPGGGAPKTPAQAAITPVSAEAH